MSEESEWWKGIKKQRQNEAADRRSVAASEFASASAMATRSGLELMQLTPTHFQLRGRGWIINLYPGNQRIYKDRSTREKAPHLELQETWRLSDVVVAAIESNAKK